MGTCISTKIEHVLEFIFQFIVKNYLFTKVESQRNLHVGMRLMTIYLDTIHQF